MTYCLPRLWYSLLLLDYKPVQHVTVLNTVGNCNTMVSVIILYYKIMTLPSYMRSVVDRNVVMRRMTVLRGGVPESKRGSIPGRGRGFSRPHST